MENPLVSVVIPIFKVEEYLNECVESVVNQSYNHLEIILVDDGSPDRCPEMCDEWAKKDNRIVVIHKANGGLSDARNAGLDVSKGEFLMFLDADDFIEKCTILDMLELAQRNDAELCCGGFFRYNTEKITPIYNRIIKNEEDVTDGMTHLKNMLLNKVDCSSCCKLFKIRSIGSLRFIKGRYNEDVMFLFSLLQSLKVVVRTSSRYYYYRETEGSITHTLNARTFDSLINTREMEAVMHECDLPLKDEIEYRKIRIALEIAYRIVRNGEKNKYRNHYISVRRLVKNGIFTIVKSPNFRLRDIIHAVIVVLSI